MNEDKQKQLIYAALRQIAKEKPYFESLTNKLRRIEFSKCKEYIISNAGYTESYWRFYSESYSVKNLSKECILDLFSFTMADVIEMLNNSGQSKTASLLALEYAFKHNKLDVATAKLYGATNINSTSFALGSSHSKSSNDEIRLFISLIQSFKSENNILTSTLMRFNDINPETANGKALKSYLLLREKKRIKKMAELSINDNEVDGKFYLEYYLQNLESLSSMLTLSNPNIRKVFNKLANDSDITIDDVKHLLSNLFTYIFEHCNYKIILKKYENLKTIVQYNIDDKYYRYWDRISDFYLDCPEKVQNVILVSELGD